MTQEPGSVHLSTLKESTQAWLTDRKIKGFYTGLTSCKSWFVCFFSMSFYLSCFCVQWLRATALRREPSPAWPWPGWASSPPTWCWLASRQTGWATCWRQSSTSLSFKEHLISILLWGFLGNFKSQWWLLPFFTTHPQCMLHTNAYPEWGMVLTSRSTSKLRRLCRAMLKVLSHVFLLERGKYISSLTGANILFLHIMTGANIFPLQLHWCRIPFCLSFACFVRCPI